MILNKRVKLHKNVKKAGGVIFKAHQESKGSHNDDWAVFTSI